jgi:hypothetical protein
MDREREILVGPKRSSTALLLASLLLLGVFVAAGCGGGSEEQPDERRQSRTPQKQGDEAGKQPTLQVKIALGKIVSADLETNRIILDQLKGRTMSFKVARRAPITLDGESAELADIKKGQQAQIQYVINNERNRARKVDAFSAGE